jgi:DNA-binding NtrC family response regulator
MTNAMTNEVLGSGSAGTALAENDDRPVVLVASDDETVLMYTTVMLKDTEQFNVIMASSSQEAIQTSKATKGEIKTLLADFRMKGMTGMELAAALTAERPNIKVLLMSDFPTGTLVLNEGWHFLPKPFVASQLTALITTLSQPDKPSRFAK